MAWVDPWKPIHCAFMFRQYSAVIRILCTAYCCEVIIYCSGKSLIMDMESCSLDMYVPIPVSRVEEVQSDKYV